MLGGGSHSHKSLPQEDLMEIRLPTNQELLLKKRWFLGTNGAWVEGIKGLAAVLKWACCSISHLLLESVSLTLHTLTPSPQEQVGVQETMRHDGQGDHRNSSVWRKPTKRKDKNSSYSINKEQGNRLQPWGTYDYSNLDLKSYSKCLVIANIHRPYNVLIKFMSWD